MAFQRAYRSRDTTADSLTPNPDEWVDYLAASSVVVIGLEELMVDRLAAWQFWRSEIDGYNAWLLWSSGNHRPNLARLRALAERNEASAALDSLVAFARTHVAREPTHTEVETWARTNP